MRIEDLYCCIETGGGGNDGLNGGFIPEIGE